MHEEDDFATETPAAVVGAVAAGTTPLPFLAVYAILFIVHGGFHHVVPPDITGNNRDELLVGIGCVIGFAIGAISIVWLLNRYRRWPFVIVELALLVISVDFFLDSTKGGRPVSGLVVVTSFLALVLAAHPQTWEHLGQPCPRFLARLFGRPPTQRPAMPVGSGPTADSTPRSARFVARRRKARINARGIEHQNSAEHHNSADVESVARETAGKRSG